MPISNGKSRGKPRKKLIHKAILAALMICILISLAFAITLFRYIFKPNVNTGAFSEVSIYIPTGAGYPEVMYIFMKNNLLKNNKSFEWVAGRKGYKDNVKAGHYILNSAMSNNQLVNMLRAGLQVPVRVTFNNIRMKEDLAGKISKQIEADSISLVHCWNDRDFLKSLGTSPEDVLTIFIPNTYELYWNTDANGFTERMHKESVKFWSGERREKLELLKLTEKEVIILASIIEKETQKNDEKQAIAGVYLNRLRRSWPLQADPTVVFANGDFELKRVLKSHTQIDSPYNTYKYTGLPPGPICIPSISSIDAVLDHQKHDYMFFCARADLSGYHVFSRTLAEHNRHARAYQKAIKNNQRD